MTPVEGAGRHIDTPVAFAGDEGAADPRLAAALGQGRGDAVLAVLTEGVRLLVPSWLSETTSMPMALIHPATWLR